MICLQDNYDELSGKNSMILHHDGSAIALSYVLSAW